MATSGSWSMTLWSLQAQTPAVEECDPTVRGVRAGESVPGAEKTVASGTGLARERRSLITGEPPKRAEDWKNRIRTLAPAWQNTYYLEDTGLFRVSLATFRRKNA